jgi:hypothetical protein
MYRNLLDVFRKSFKRNGVAGLYQGVESKMYWEREKSGQENQRGGSALNGSSPVFEQQFDALARQSKELA